MPLSLNQLSSILRYYRNKSGMTQGEVAKAIGVSKKTIQRLENKGNRNPSYILMMKIVDYYDLTIQELSDYIYF